MGVNPQSVSRKRIREGPAEPAMRHNRYQEKSAVRDHILAHLRKAGRMVYLRELTQAIGHSNDSTVLIALNQLFESRLVVFHDNDGFSARK